MKRTPVRVVSLAFVLLCSLLVAEASGALPPASAPPTPTLRQAENPKKPSTKARDRALRHAAQKKAALAWGAQSGFSARTKKRNDWLLAHEEILDRVFTFGPFVYGDHILLPAIAAGRRDFRLERLEKASSSIVSYRIESRARIVSIRPTFREFLMIAPGTPKRVNPILLPKNSREKKLWKKWTDDGWTAGETLSDRAFVLGVRRLVREIEGRIRFMELALAGQVEYPTYARTAAGILRTGDSLEIGDSVLRITRPASFTGSDRWRPLSYRDKEGEGP
jgi:defect-in-organelle-trafficking protein DotC